MKNQTKKLKMIVLKRVTVLGLLLSLFLSSFGFAEVTPDEFKQETKRHIERLVLVGEQFEKWSNDQFPNLNPVLVKDYLKIHDAPKLMELEELRRYGYTEKKPIYKVFSALHGKNFKDLPDEERALADRVRDQLNEIEKIIKEEYFHSLDLKPKKLLEVRSELSTLEHIVDITDTGLYRLGEVGSKNTKKYDGANWLEKGGMKASLVKLSVRIEDNINILLLPLKKKNVVMTCKKLL